MTIRGILAFGPWSVFLLMFLQNILPILPSEVIMPLAGFLSLRGHLNLGLAIALGTAGSLLGHLPWYFFGATAGRERVDRWLARYGRWVGIRPEHVLRADSWFSRHRTRAVFLGRLVPGVRSLVNIPAGATRMPLFPFLLYTAAGDLLWTATLAVAGYNLGREYHRIAHVLHLLIVPFLVLVCLVLAFSLRRGRRRKPRPPPFASFGAEPDPLPGPFSNVV